MKVIIILLACFMILTCSTKENRIAHIYKPVTLKFQSVDKYRLPFINNVKGSYNNDIDIDSEGSFTLDGIKFSIHDVLNDSQSIYISEVPLENSKKKIYYYHGISFSDDTLYVQSYKVPLFENYIRLTPKDTEFYWGLNTFRIENINWKSSFRTIVAIKNN